MGTLDRHNEAAGRKKRAPLFRAAATPLEKDESEARWLMSYSDFMMQLVCLFILLYSVSAIDPSKAVPLAQAWREEVGIGEAGAEPAPKSPHAPLTLSDLSPVIREIQVLAGRHPDGGSLRVTRTAVGFRLHFVYEMFDRCSDRLGRRGRAVADVAAMVLQPIQNRVLSIEVVGHASADEPDALALSLARAGDAVRWMTRPEALHRLDAATVRAAGRGSHEPSADNAETAGRAINRRVEFVVRLGESTASR